MTESFSFDVPGGAITAGILLVLFALACALSLRALWDPARAELRRGRRWSLALLRVLTALGALLVASSPTWNSERGDDEPGHLAVLLDVSRSMQVGADRGAEHARIARALRYVEGARAEAMERGVSLFTFGARVRASAFDAPLEGFAAVEDDTRVGDAITAMEADASAIVLVSDGADLQGDAVLRAEASGLRVHSVFVSDEEPLVDDSIARLDYDRVGFVRRPARVRAELRSYGRPAHTVLVSLFEGDRLLRQEEVELPADASAEVSFEVTPSATGRALYRLALPHAPEDAIAENDERSFLVRVQRDNLRVLLVAGRPSWDERFLRAFLKRDPTTDLISFFILRNTSDMTMADSDELALIPFPTSELFNEHLGSFDIVLFQNFDFAPYQMDVYLPRIREYVERGGSFAMIGGPLTFTEGGYAETAIGELLPVELLPTRTPTSRSLSFDEFVPRVAEGAHHHPLVELSPDRHANELAWRALAPLEGVNVARRLRSHGQRLLEHPSLLDDDGRPLPVLASGDFGRGRVLALMTDTSWRWGMPTAGEGADGATYERFWDTAVRWLARDPSLDPARLSTDRERYGPGASVRVEGTLRDVTYQPLADERVRVSIVDASGAEVSGSDTRADVNGQLGVTLEAPARAGGYRVLARRASPSGERANEEALAEEVFLVELGGDELADPRPNEALMRALAERTSGRFTALADAGPLAGFDASRTRVREITRARPFSGVPFVALVLVLFGIEWILRRRFLG